MSSLLDVIEALEIERSQNTELGERLAMRIADIKTALSGARTQITVKLDDLQAQLDRAADGVSAEIAARDNAILQIIQGDKT